MDKYERIFRLHGILSMRRTPVAAGDLMDMLDGCSRATLYRDIAFLRDALGAPLDTDGDTGGFLYRPHPDARAYELPGLWFTAAELQALVTFHGLLDRLGSGLLSQHLAPLATRIEQLISHRRLHLNEVPRRIRLLGGPGRGAGAAFHTVASAVLQRQQLVFHYHSRFRDQHTERRVSPQRLAHYRDNWYVDAWDPSRNALRTFAVDRISHAQTLDTPAEDIAEAELDAHFSSAYGIFAGRATRTAVLRFSASRARWIADERWHPQQSGQFLTDGRYELRVPYRDPRELVMDILRHGAAVEVIEPASLRTIVRAELLRALDAYPEHGMPDGSEPFSGSETTLRNDSSP